MSSHLQRVTRALLALGLLLLAPLAESATMLSLAPARIGERFPHFQATGCDGTALDTSTIAGPFAVYFWATWFPPAEDLLPRLQRVHEHFGDELTILGITLDAGDAEADVMACLAERGIAFPVVHDTQRVLGDHFKVDSLPALFLVDGDQRVVSLETGIREVEQSALWRTWRVPDLPNGALGMATEAGSPAAIGGTPLPARVTLVGEGNPKVGDRFPDFRLTCLDGREVATASFFGKPFLVCFWASWSPPSRQLLQDLQRLHQQHSDELLLLAIALDSPGTAGNLPMLIEEYAVTFPVAYAGPGVLMQQFGIRRLPDLLYADANHRVVARSSGLSEGHPVLQAFPLADG